jgi:hypothetical protein
MPSNEEKLNNLADRLGLAKQEVEEMTEDVEESFDTLAITEIAEPGQHLPQTIPEEVFTTDLLKTDFMMMRSNILAIINRGQSIVEQCSIMELGDMKAGQMEALATLQKSVGENIKLLTGIYKDIVSIEKDKKFLAGTGANPDVPVATGGMHITGNVQQNYVLSGTNRDLLKSMQKDDGSIDVTPGKHAKGKVDEDDS